MSPGIGLGPSGHGFAGVGCGALAALRDAAAALSLAACDRVAGVTQTTSPPNASRHTKPCLQLLGP
jgi:hypothetical protein